MRLTVLRQTAKGLAEKTAEGDDQHPLRQPVLDALESIKCYLWHGNVFQATKHLDILEEDLAVAADILDDGRTAKLVAAVEEFHAYIDNNRDFIPNYGERYRHGETISIAIAESTVNQVISKRMVKRQQIQWSQRGAHVLLQTRTRVLNDELEKTFRQGGTRSFGQKCRGRLRLRPDPPVFRALPGYGPRLRAAYHLRALLPPGDGCAAQRRQTPPLGRTPTGGIFEPRNGS